MKGAFERHLREAIALNRDREGHYASCSGGASRPISRALIGSEFLLLPLARWLDRRAEPYHRAGIPLLEALFVDMIGAPDCMAGGRPTPPAGYTPPDAASLRSRIRLAHRRAGFTAADRVLEAELERLKGQPGVDCMLRHLLESALRLAKVAPGHEDQALRLGLPSPAWIHRLLFRLHLWGLSFAVRLDRKARPLQLGGLPILCRDIPNIPPWPDSRPAVEVGGQGREAVLHP